MAQSGRKSRRSFWKVCLCILLALAIFPAFEVLLMRFVNPIYTPLMLIRRIEGRHNVGNKPTTTYGWIGLENVSNNFLKAVWQTEDARFFQHNGFDWIEVDHAMADSHRTNQPARGASTITMQCARSLFLWQGRSWIRKPIEAYYTVLMEAMLTKRRIFELYVNVIETGDGLYGVEAAARYYWRMSARKLTAEQAASLVAILPNPRLRDPIRPTAKVVRRAALVLRKLQKSPRWPLP